MDDALFERYINDDLFELIKMKDLLKDEKELNKIYLKSIERMEKRNKQGTPSLATLEERQFRHMRFENVEWDTINKMLKDGLIIKEKENIAINQPMKSTLYAFFTFLKDKKEIKEDFLSLLT